MKWFKHHTNMLSKSETQTLLDKHGTAGIYAWLRLLEILAEEFDVDNPGIFMTSKWKIFEQIFPKSCQRTGKKILEFFQSKGWIQYKIYGKEILIKCDEMKKLADEYTQKILKKRAQKKDESVGTNSRHGVGIPFGSSSKSTNTKIKTKGKEREEKEKERDSNFGHDIDFDEFYARWKKEQGIK